MDRTQTLTAAAAPAALRDGSYIDWAAIFGGAVVAVAVGSVFTGFGAALGLSTISAEPGEGSLNVMVIVSALWVVVTLVASYMAGGYIAGRMRRRLETSTAADEVTVRDGINGLVVWGLGIIATLFLLGSAVSTTVSAVGSAASTAGTVAGGVVSAAGSAVGGVAQGAAAAVGAALPEEAGETAASYVSDTLLRPAQATAGTSDAAVVARETASIIGNIAVTGNVTDAERAYLISAVVATTSVSQAEATARVDEAIAAAQQTRTDAIAATEAAQAEADRLVEEARVAAVDAAEAARVSAILTAFLLTAAAIVAAAAAYIGAVRGGRHRDEGRIFGGFAYRG